MTRRAAWVSWSAWGVAMIVAGVAIYLLLMNARVSSSAFTPYVFIVPGFATVGAFISSRSRNPVGRLFLATGLILAGSMFCVEYAIRGLGTAPGSLPIASYLAPFGNVGFPVSNAALLLTCLLFPNGKLPSKRWKPLLWILLVTWVLFIVAAVFDPHPIESGIYRFANPFGVRAVGSLWFLPLQTEAATQVWSLFAVGTALACGVAPFVRWRTAKSEEREQLKWFAFVVSALLVLGVASGAFAIAHVNSVVSIAFDIVTTLGLAVGIPVAIGIAVLKYRLYDIDVVINKTVVFGGLAAFITAVYVGIVVGIGAAIGQGTSKPNLGLSILATAVVAVAFQPVRERIQRFANRLVYGKRATPYEVLSEFSHRMAGTYAADDVLPRMTRILAEGTGAREAGIWLGVSGRLIPAAFWPDAGGIGSSTRPAGADLLVPVTHQGEELGALSITKAAGERLTPAEEKLTTDLASQAGLVLRNVKLIEDLKASRVRLVQAQDKDVAAQDAAARRLERNIHDGAQQQLVALQVKMGLAKRLTGDPGKLDEVFSQLQAETNQALQDLRDLARGIYPPLLADQGLVAALEAQARRAAIPVTVEADSIVRYPQDVEAAVYFCVLEALQNVAKYANATQASVTLSATDGQLAFAVTDDGAGFDSNTTSYGTGLQGMADRLAVLGGEIDVRSVPGPGTTVDGRLPVRALEPVSS